MKVKNEVVAEIKTLINNYHNGVISDFSRDTEIDKSYISEVLAGKRGIGTIFINKMNKYCENKKIRKINFFI